jgi:GntR family transcriptional repressor for pyruvate dehydrogenase complex
MEQAIIRPKKLYEQVADRIAEAIRSNEYSPGDQLPWEGELMERFGVGRPAIREALFALQRMGLVEVRSGTRAKVTEPTPDRLISELSEAAKLLLVTDAGIRQFQDARASFETGLARHAALHATPQDLRELEEALRANEQAIDDLKAFAKTDVEFHFVLAKIRRNSIFAAMHQAIAEWLTEQRTTALQIPDENRIACAAHKAIYEGVASGDPDRAERAMTDHLAQVAKVYWEVKEGLAEPGVSPRSGNLRAERRS